MTTVSVSLPQSITELEIVPLSDTHIGDPHANQEEVRKTIQYIKDTPNAYTILNGDLINNALSTSPSATYEEVWSPMIQVQNVIEMFEPIKDKILAVTQGNHERRTQRVAGVDLSQFIASALGIADRYSEGMVYIFLRFGDKGAKEHHRKMRYGILATHGSGGGRSVGSKANRLADLVSIADADLYLYGHTHETIAFKRGFMRVDACNDQIGVVDRLFVNSGAFLSYGGYAEQAQFVPSVIDIPHIFLSGTKRDMYVRI